MNDIDMEHLMDAPFFVSERSGVEEYVDVLMAMAMQESSGRLLDVMQSSESLGLPVNSIVDPERSIEQGVNRRLLKIDNTIKGC
jgi:hypothetical protein